MSDDYRPIAIALDALADIRAGADNSTDIAARALACMDDPNAIGTGGPLVAFVADMSARPPTLSPPTFGWDTSADGLTVRLDIRADMDSQDGTELAGAILTGVRDALAMAQEARYGIH